MATTGGGGCGGGGVDCRRPVSLLVCVGGGGCFCGASRCLLVSWLGFLVVVVVLVSVTKLEVLSSSQDDR